MSRLPCTRNTSPAIEVAPSPRDAAKLSTRLQFSQNSLHFLLLGQSGSWQVSPSRPRMPAKRGNSSRRINSVRESLPAGTLCPLPGWQSIAGLPWAHAEVDCPAFARSTFILSSFAPSPTSATTDLCPRAYRGDRLVSRRYERQVSGVWFGAAYVSCGSNAGPGHRIHADRCQSVDSQSPGLDSRHPPLTRGESEKFETKRDSSGKCWDVPGATESRRDDGTPLRKS
jgi:hypothetical protein